MERKFSPEKAVWTVSPSPISIAPWVFLWILIPILAFPHLDAITQYIVNVTHETVILWTQSKIDILSLAMYPLLALPLLFCLFDIFALRFTQYELTTQRLMIHKGMLVRRHDEIALHRIQDYVVKRPFFGMFLGYGNIKLITRDPTTPILDMNLITDAYERSEDIRRNAILWKEATGFREFDGGDLR